MADTMTFGDYTYTNNEAGYNQFVSDVNAGKLHVEDLGSNFFSSENKLDDYLVDNFKDKNLSIVTYANEDGTHSMKIVDPNNAAEVDALRNIKIADTNGNSAADISQYSHGTWEEEEAVKKLINGDYKNNEATIYHSNSPTSGGKLIAGTEEGAARGAKSAEITNNIIGGQGGNVNLNSQGYSLGNWHNLNNLKNVDFSKLGDGKINLDLNSLPSFGPFTTSIDDHVATFKELCKNPEFVEHLGTIDFQLDGGTGSDNKFHPPKATAEFWDKCMEDPELKKVLEEHTTQETKDKIAAIDRNEKSYWDKLQMGMIIAAIAIAVIAIIILAVYLYKRHKKKKAEKEAQQRLQNGNKENYGNCATPVQPTMNNQVVAPTTQNYQDYYQQYQQTTSNNQQSQYNLQSIGQAQGQWR